MTKILYPDTFYLNNEQGSELSASRVVPELLHVMSPRSVVDVGCGLGTWAFEFRARGISDVVGVDGEYVNRSILKISSELFLTRDLEKPLAIGREFDLAVCVEVAEHLSEGRSDGFVSDLVSLAPAVLFSAAIPNQGGYGHVNEQWPDYWEEKFRRHGYVALDFLRAALWNDEAVAWWYRQNLILYGRESYVAANPMLARIAERRPSAVLRLVHPRLYESLLNKVERPCLGAVIRSLPSAIKRSLEYRLLGSVPKAASRNRVG